MTSCREVNKKASISATFNEVKLTVNQQFQVLQKVIQTYAVCRRVSSSDILIFCEQMLCRWTWYLTAGEIAAK